MKKISELTEKEILALKEDEIVQMIKFKMAEEGIKLVSPPIKPALHQIPPMDQVVYKCNLFGGNLVFRDITDLEMIIQNIKDSVVWSTDSDYFSSSSASMHLLSKLRNVGYGSEEWDAIQTAKVYSVELYGEVKSAIEQNKKIEESYKKRMAEYTASQDGVVDIQNEIRDRVREVRDKYSTLDHYTTLFKSEYMPLASEDEKVAMNFLNKAYSLKAEDQAYVLANYKNK